MITGKRFVITGGAGFIGSNTVLELVKNNNKVIAIDNLSTGNMRNLSEVGSQISFVNGDIQDLDLLKEQFTDADYVLHYAALASVPQSVKDPIAANRNNIDGTLNVLIAARDTGVERVVCISSSAVYGDSPVLPKTEDMKPEPLTPYALTKLVGEQYCKLFYDLYGLETVSLRYFNVFGPHQDENSQYAAVIPKFITAMLKNERPTIYGDGEQSRDFTYIKDTVEATLITCDVKAAAGKVFNIASGETITLNELLDKLNIILNTEIKPKYAHVRSGDIKHSMADISRAQKVLGLEPKYGIEYGLQKTIDWFKNRES